MSISEEKKQEYLDLIADIIENADAAGDEYKKVSRSASTLCDVNQAVSYNPNMSVVRNNGGVVIGYDYKYTGPTKPNTDALDVNSNNDTGLYGEVDAITGAAPHVKPPTTTRVSGGIVNDVLDKVGQFTSGLIDTSWGVVSALSKFGKNVAGTAADAIQATGALMGDTFDHLLTRSTETGANAIRALFGVDTNGSTTMYIDEDTLGALAILLRDAGFFERDPISEATAKPEGATDSGYNGVTYPVEFTSFAFVSANPFDGQNFSYSSYPVYTSRQSRYKVCFLSNVYGGVVHAIRATRGGEYFYFGISGDQSYTFREVVYDPNTYQIIGVMDITPRYLTTDSLGNKMMATSNMSPGFNYFRFEIPEYNGYNQPWALMATFYGEVHQSGGIPGVDDQPGATDVSSAIVGNDPHIVSNELFTNYSQVMGEPLLVNVMDDSCNQVTNRYFSVPISYSPTNINVSAPITGTVQLNPSFNPDISLDPSINLDRLVDQIVLQLQGSNAGEDVVIIVEDPDDPSEEPGGDVQVLTPTIPNTGIGETPETQLPQVNVQGMWHVYNPSSSEVSALGTWLWSANIVDQIIRLFQNPLDAVIGLHAIFGEPHVSSSASIVVGNLTSTVSSRVVSSQYTQVDCGSVWLTEYFGNVFDYAPYTSVSLFLPFIGIVDLDVGDVMRAEIGVIYNIDVYTGACIAQVSVTRDGVGGVVYQYPGKCSVEYPISGASYSRMLQGVLGAAVSAIGSGVATGGNPVMGAIAAGSSFISGGEKIQVQRSGSFSGNAGAMGSKIPYLIIRRPQTNMAINFERYDGRGSNFSSMLSQCSGYTRCKEVHLNVPGAYKEELDEITRLLKEGVILP